MDILYTWWDANTHAHNIQNMLATQYTVEYLLFTLMITWLCLAVTVQHHKGTLLHITSLGTDQHSKYGFYWMCIAFAPFWRWKIVSLTVVKKTICTFFLRDYRPFWFFLETTPDNLWRLNGYLASAAGYLVCQDS